MARYGHAVVPMDEALVECALDFSNRSYLGLHQMVFPKPQWGVRCVPDSGVLSCGSE